MGNRIGYPTRYSFFVQPSPTPVKEATNASSTEQYDEIPEEKKTDRSESEKENVEEQKPSLITNKMEAEPAVEASKEKLIEETIDSVTETMAKLNTNEKTGDDEPKDKEEPADKEPPKEKELPKEESDSTPPPVPPSSHKKKRYRPHKK